MSYTIYRYEDNAPYTTVDTYKEAVSQMKDYFEFDEENGIKEKYLIIDNDTDEEIIAECIDDLPEIDYGPEPDYDDGPSDYECDQACADYFNARERQIDRY